MYFYTLLPLKPTQGDHNGKVLNKSSKISGFYKLSPEERLEMVTIYSGLTEEEASSISATGALSLDAATGMVGNLIGIMGGFHSTNISLFIDYIMVE